MLSCWRLRGKVVTTKDLNMDAAAVDLNTRVQVQAQAPRKVLEVVEEALRVVVVDLVDVLGVAVEVLVHPVEALVVSVGLPALRVVQEAIALLALLLRTAPNLGALRLPTAPILGYLLLSGKPNGCEIT